MGSVAGNFAPADGSFPGGGPQGPSPSSSFDGIRPPPSKDQSAGFCACGRRSSPGFAARFYRALAIYLSTTVRERHRDLGSGGEGDEEEEDPDELDPNVLDGVYLAGERFDRMVKRVMV